MTYEIPQSLQYKERIVFNLTLEQFIYAAGFGLVSFLLYAKLPYSIPARIAIACIPACLGLLFMYFDLWQKVSDFWAWYRFRKATMFSPELKKYLKLNAIEDSCYYVQTKNGEKRVAVLKIEPLNFKIKPKDERDSIIHSFQKLLNALDFPIQFAMYTDDLNLSKYVRELGDRVQKTKNAVCQDLFKAHTNALDSLMKERLSANRRFFIAVQESAMGLEAQLRILEELLRGMNLKSARLGGRQLIRLLIKFFNNPRGRTELLKKHKTLYNIVAPESIENRPDVIKVNEYYNRIITVIGYPRMVEEGFLDKIITATGNFGSVNEVKAAMSNVIVWGKFMPQIQGIPTLHVALHDAYGNNAVIEFIDGQQKFYDNQNGVLTNEPTIDWQIINLRNYINLRTLSSGPVSFGGMVLKPTGQGTGLLGIPGDWTPPSRFVRATSMLHFAKPAVNSLQGVNLAEHILNAVDIPKRDVAESAVASDYTQWVLIKDLTNKVVYFRSYEDLTLRAVDLKRLNLRSGVRSIPISSGRGIVDVSFNLR